MMDSVDINCDMGEGFGQWEIGESLDEELMSIISSSNIAAGFHAGDPNSVQRLVKMAKSFDVKVGVHPGYQDLRGFGRRYIQTTTGELINDIIYQIGALREFTSLYDISLQHIKLHGALYMEAAKNKELSEVLVRTLQKISPELLLYCMDISNTYHVAKNLKHPTIREFFADREYDDTGSIVFTRNVGQLDPNEIAKKCLRACKEGIVRTVNNTDIKVSFESICFHSDTPGALEIGKALHKILKNNNIEIIAPTE